MDLRDKPEDDGASMKLPTDLQRGRLIRRYKRFLADIVLDDGREIVAHCPNPGSMMGLKDEGLEVWVAPAANPKAKLAWRWCYARRADGILAGIDTNMPNRLVKEALAAGRIAEVAAYPNARPEVKYREGSRVDFLLTGEGMPDCYFEVKNVHLMRRPGLVEFPDSVTARGAKHMGDLAAMRATGARAVVLFCIQMTGADRFALADDLDPGYARAFDAARASGVEALAYACRIDDPDAPEGGIVLDRRIPMAR
jgi:sugar fermentation stimulation protein A